MYWDGVERQLASQAATITMARNEGAMKGVSYLVDASGKKTAVILDLRRYRRIWEDIQDRLLVESRRREPRSSLEQVKKRFARRTSRADA
jgi:hypothetical protein